jgi:hypothetical protein
MTYSTQEIVERLLTDIAAMQKVQAIGISGDISSYPKAGEGDIDVFIYCNTIPQSQSRQEVLIQAGEIVENIKINVFDSEHWGIGDFVTINGVETWLMYFTENAVIEDMEAILRGDYPDKQDKYYYPVGRLAMLKGINIICDKDNFLSSIKIKLTLYPEELAMTIIDYHIDGLKDTEDLERAVVRRDVLFYHFSIDIAVDHFLQALFALNKTYFPSRKRSLEFIKRFSIKPDRCEERLLEVIKSGSYAESIVQSYEVWCGLVKALETLKNP